MYSKSLIKTFEVERKLNQMSYQANWGLVPYIVSSFLKTLILRHFSFNRNKYTNCGYKHYKTTRLLPPHIRRR